MRNWRAGNTAPGKEPPSAPGGDCSPILCSPVNRTLSSLFFLVSLGIPVAAYWRTFLQIPMWLHKCSTPAPRVRTLVLLIPGPRRPVYRQRHEGKGRMWPSCSTYENIANRTFLVTLPVHPNPSSIHFSFLAHAVDLLLFSGKDVCTVFKY